MIILLSGGVYFGLRFTFGVFTPYNFWTAQQNIKNGKIQIGEMPLNFDQKQKLANSYLERKVGAGWWTKFQNQLNSIDKEIPKTQKPTTTKLPYKNVSDIIADSNYSTWVDLKDNNASLALHFMGAGRPRRHLALAT